MDAPVDKGLVPRVLETDHEPAKLAAGGPLPVTRVSHVQMSARVIHEPHSRVNSFGQTQGRELQSYWKTAQDSGLPPNLHPTSYRVSWLTVPPPHLLRVTMASRTAGHELREVHIRLILSSCLVCT